MNLRIVGAAVVALGASLAESVAGQSLQRLSVQGSGAVLFTNQDDPSLQSRTRLGWEAQARYTFGRFSLGAGYQRSTVLALTQGTPPPTLQLSFGFIEPRVVLAASRWVAFYIAGRGGAGKLVSASSDFRVGKTNIGYGGGGGLLFRLSSRLSGDLGGQYFQVRGDFSSRYAMIRAGLGFGL
jgi:opacity protein-like surface antigen